MRFAVLLLFAAGSLSAAPVPRDFKKPDDRELLVGTWKPVDKGTANFRFSADGTMKTWHSQTADSTLDWTWTSLDTKATPKRVTLTRTVGSGTYDCIFEVSGDRLKLAFIIDKTKPIPDKVQAGPGFSFYDLARENPAK